MLKKKGFEIQFNWIFVLVAGAAILILFTAVIVKQKGLSETSAKATVLKSVEAIITSASVSTDTIKKIDIPNSNLEVSCNRISVGGISKQYQNLILFAPSSVKGDKLITQTLAFSVPYRATNLLYMTSSKVRYIIIANPNNDLAKAINKSLPSDLKKEFYESIPTIRNENNYKVRLIVFDNFDLNQITATFPNTDITAVKINGNNDKGTIEFLQKTEREWSSKGSSKYLGKSSLIGAVYSDTKEAYECNMNNVFSKLNQVTKIYVERTRRLSGSTSSRCDYTNALRRLAEIDSASSSFSDGNVNAIVTASNSISGENNIQKINSCPLIY